jgi:CRP-like cAMP-binding protein
MENNLLHLLQNCPASINQSFRQASFKEGDLILTQGDPPQYVYILLKGEAGVYQLTTGGLVFQPYLYRENELFGEIEVLNGKAIVSNVRANRFCQAICIPGAGFIDWLQNDPAFSLYIQRQLAEKLYNNSINAVTHIVYPLRYRLMYYLWNVYQQGTIYVKKEDIIAGLGSNERSVNRILKELLDLTLVEADRGVVKIISVERMLAEMRQNI